MRALRTLHLTAGIVTLAAFLGSGAYMRFAAHPDTLGDREHLMYVSRHIYCLGAALVHLCLALYVTPRDAAPLRRLQWIGSVLLALASALLITAFATEAMAGRPRSFASTWGLYLFFGGVMLHVLAGIVVRVRGSQNRR